MSPRAAAADLGKLASVARRALAADALLIATRSGDGPPRWPGVAGVAPDDLPAIGRALEGIERSLEQSSKVRAMSLHDCDRPCASVLVRHGFRSALFAAVQVDAEHAGEIYALRRTEGSFDDEELVLAFARHAAVTVAHGRLRRHTETLAERLESREVLDHLVLSANNFAELSQKLNLHVAPLFGAAMTGIMVWDEQREVLQMVAGSFGADEQLAASYQISSSDAHSNAGRVFSTGRPHLSNQVRGDPGVLQDYVDAFGIERTLSLPLRVGDQTIGVLHIANKATDFTMEDVGRAELLAPRIATVVELARSVFRLRRQQTLEGILSRLAVSIASGERVQDFLRPALRDLCAAADACFIALTAEDSAPILVRRDGINQPALEAAVFDLTSRQGRTSSSVNKPQHPGDPGWAALHVPVRLGAQRVGSIAALRIRGEPFAADERQALERLASLAALAYASERYQKQRAELVRLEERDRIADDLHDDVAQILFVAQLALDTALDREDLPPRVAEDVLRARGMLVKGDAAVREVIHQLARPAGSELPELLGGVVSTVQQAYGLPIDVEITHTAKMAVNRISGPVSDSLVKVARETLVNAAKHAGPCRVVVRLDLDARERLRLAVADDGVGPAEADGAERHGLASLRRSVERRGGTLDVRAGAAGGFEVTAVVPL